MNKTCYPVPVKSCTQRETCQLYKNFLDFKGKHKHPNYNRNVKSCDKYVELK